MTATTPASVEQRDEAAARKTAEPEPHGSTPGTRRFPISAGYMAGRLLIGAVSVLMIITIVFGLLQLTGDPIRAVAPLDASQEEIDRIAAAYGFDQSLLAQYWSFLTNALTLRFPDSVVYGQPAFDVVARALIPTLTLMGTAFLLATIIGLGIGYYAVNGRHPRARGAVFAAVQLGSSVPPFFLAIVGVLIFGVVLGVLPVSGYGSWQYAVLPLAVLTVTSIPGTARVFRAQILETRSLDHVEFARSKGISERAVRLRHIGVNALGPAIALIGMQLGGLVAGAVTIEVIFRWPGIGQLLWSSISGRDYPVALAAVLLVSAGYVLASLLADIASAAIDPVRQRSR